MIDAIYMADAADLKDATLIEVLLCETSGSFKLPIERRLTGDAWIHLIDDKITAPKPEPLEFVPTQPIGSNMWFTEASARCNECNYFLSQPRTVCFRCGSSRIVDLKIKR